MRVTMAASTWNISLRENAERMGHWTAVTGSNMTGSGTGDGQLCYNYRAKFLNVQNHDVVSQNSVTLLQ